MKVFLTGANGMVGRNVLGHTGANHHSIMSPSRKELDLMDFQSVLSFLYENKPDLIIHAAGKVGGIKANIDDPCGFLFENSVIGLNVIRAAKETGVDRLLNLSTSCIYPREATNPLQESQILTGALEPTNEAYALSKIITARACDYISLQYKELNYKTIIPCNLYGPFDKFEGNNAHLIPAIISKIHKAVHNNEDSVEIWGDGAARREFMFVGDLAELIWEAIARFDSLPQTMNVGIGRDHSIKEYYEAAASVIGYCGNFTFNTKQPVGMNQKLTSTKKVNSWGWHPQTDLSTGIQKTYDFYKGVKS
jgi:GDP-L-fucose synthase